MTLHSEVSPHHINHEEIQELVEQVREIHLAPSKKPLLQVLDELHPSDVSRLIQYLEVSERKEFMEWFAPFCNPETLLFLDDTVRRDLIDSIDPMALGRMLEALESDDAISILEDLDSDLQKIILESIGNSKRRQFQKRLLYPEDSAGRLMQEEVLALPKHWDIKKTLEHIAQDQDLPTNFYELYVMDDSNRPIGVVSLSQLIKRPKNLLLENIMEEEFHYVPTDMDQNDVANLFRKYDLVSAPAINESGELVGMITIDDVVDVIDEKAEEDMLHMGRIATSDFYAPILETSFGRMRWLIVTLVNSLLASLVIDQFEHTVLHTTGLAALMPIVAAMAGNSGMQSVTVTLRALVTRELSMVNMRRAVVKEGCVALLNGLCFALLLGGITYYWYKNLNLALVLGVAVIFDMLWAGLAGTFLPVLVAHYKKDPTLSAGPLLTTSTDVLGFAIFLGLASMFL
jgi:magnesium transporter